MEISLSDHLSRQVEQQIATGSYRTADELMEEAVSLLLDQRARAEGRIESLRRIEKMVEEAGLADKVLLPGDE